MANLNEISELFDKVDIQTAFMGRVGEIIGWLETLSGVEAVGLICTDRLYLGADDHSIHRIAAAKASLLPTEPAILNGRSPIPSGVFHGSNLSPVTVYSPFLDHTGGVAGAILVKSSGPKQFLKHNRSVLGLLSSKTRDLVEIASLRSNTGAVRPDYQLDDLTPRVVGKLMDLLNLSAYVMSPDGVFISVNQRFLDGFHYANLDDLNSRSGVFLRENDFGLQLQRLT